jgi:polysaccharide deacetylase family protein (PEP-CTERM system associated)
MKNPYLLTFDVEDWFQVENLKSNINRNEWEEKKLRVKDNTQQILKILDHHNTKATFFILGWIAERVPELVKEIYKKGHEIASHGYEHQLVYNLSPEEFRKDLLKSKDILESIINDRVYGYRAPSFSITNWALDILKEEKFIYDSSFFPANSHDRYSKLDLNIKKHGFIKILDNGLKEINISTLSLFNKELPWGGGGYFRLLPYWLFKLGYKKLYKEKKGAIFYFHPWELDAEQPRINDIKASYKFRHYYGLNKSEEKLKNLVRDFKFMPIINYLDFN